MKPPSTAVHMLLSTPSLGSGMVSAIMWRVRRWLTEPRPLLLLPLVLLLLLLLAAAEVPAAASRVVLSTRRQARLFLQAVSDSEPASTTNVWSLAFH